MRSKANTVWVYTLWSELGESPVALPAIARQLAEFDLESTLKRLCWISLLVSLDPPSNQLDAMEYLLGKDVSERVAQVDRNRKSTPLVFHRQQMLLAIKLVVLNCAEGGSRHIDNDDDRFALGRLLLQINDNLEGRGDEQLSTDLIERPSDLNSALGAAYLLSNHQQYEMYSVRYQRILFEQVPDALSTLSKPRDLWEKKFRERHGIDLEQMWVLALALVRMIDRNLFTPSSERPPIFDTESGHVAFKWDQNDYQKAISLVASTVEAFRGSFGQPSGLPFTLDFEPFRRTPFVQVGNEIVCVDRNFVLELLGEQTLWRVRECFTRAEGQNDYGAVLGEAVERYAKWVLRSAFPNPEGKVIDRFRVPRQIKIKTGHTIRNPDFEIRSDPVSQLFECKGFLFTNRALFSVDGNALGEELRKKLADERGVRQLATYMAWRLRFPTPGDPNRYQAILLTLDRTLSFPGMQRTLRTRAWQYFEEAWRAIDETKGEVQPVPHPSILRFLAIGIQELEMIAAYVRGGADITDLVDQMIRHDPEGMSFPRVGIDHARYNPIADWRFLSDADPSLERLWARHFGQ